MPVVPLCFCAFTSTIENDGIPEVWKADDQVEKDPRDPDTDTLARLQQAALTHLSTIYCEKFWGHMITDEMVCAGTSGSSQLAQDPAELLSTVAQLLDPVYHVLSSRG
ncbi:hypothetical protein A6R68_20427 [Neotoma lepida]|uniref:Uncharacterized protein n=1 Tax=Neotoma lepida TaxID=56216 RepID=A0A1A6HT57_NEOLE|nr:hypothetical protein A6R68_20427 [Neotoma lepida]